MKLVDEAATILEERYPQLSFLLQVINEKPFCFCEEGKNGRSDTHFLYIPEKWEWECARLPKKSQLKKVNVLYIYGLGLGRYYFLLQDWLEEDPTREIVFLEEDIEVIRLFMQCDWASQLLKDSQVHLRFCLNRKSITTFATECAKEFPVEHAYVIALATYKERFRTRFYRLRIALLRATTVEHALIMEGLYYHLLTKNFFPNYSHFTTAFSANHFANHFSNVPAIICGAGPSLESQLPLLQTLETRALILAGGSAITALSHSGIAPHLSLAIDPNFEEYNRFRISQAFDGPLLYVPRVHPRIFQTCSGPLGYLHTLVGGPAEMWMEKYLHIDCPPLCGGFDIEAMSVTTTAIELACTMGCNPIILVGVDLAFTSGASYAANVIANARFERKNYVKEKRASEQLLLRKDRKGRNVYTLVKWIMESGAISRFTKKHRAISFINSTEGGIGFTGIPYRALADISFPYSFDLRGKIASLIATNQIGVEKKELKKAFLHLQNEIKKAVTYCKTALAELDNAKGKDPETGKLIFCTLELEALDAYKALLQPLCLALERSLSQRYHISYYFANEKEQWERKQAYLLEKWQTLMQVTTLYVNQLDSVLLSPL